MEVKEGLELTDIRKARVLRWEMVCAGTLAQVVLGSLPLFDNAVCQRTWPSSSLTWLHNWRVFWSSPTFCAFAQTR